MGLVSFEAKGQRSRMSQARRLKAGRRSPNSTDGAMVEPVTLAQLIREELLTSEEAEDEQRFAEELKRRQTELQELQKDLNKRRLTNEEKRKELSLRWRHLEERRSARLDYYYAKLVESRSQAVSRADTNVPQS